MNELLDKFRGILNDSGVLVGEQITEKYQADWSGEQGCRPLAVLRPRDTAQVAAILRLCNNSGQKVSVQGGMSGLAGGAVPAPDELALSLERMHGIEEIDTDAMTLTALAGTPLATIQQAAKQAGYFFPLDLGARGSCHIGGNLATNAGGNQVLRYGMVRNLVLGLEAVLADGTIISAMNKMLKNNAGYDLKHLFIGSEGTLGIITRVVLRLYPLTSSTCTALCALNTFEDAIGLLKSTQSELVGALSSFEAMWANYFHYVTDNVKALHSPFERHFPLYVLLEMNGADQGQDQEKFERVLEHALESGLVVDAVIAQSIKEAQHFWQIRDGIGEILPGLSNAANFDVSIPIGHMQAFLTELEQQIHQRSGDTTLLSFGHIGDGNLHIFITTESKQDKQKTYALGYALTEKYQGAVTAEHGIGTTKTDYLPHSRTQAEIELMRRLKKCLDPGAILNSGRIIQADTITTNSNTEKYQ